MAIGERIHFFRLLRGMTQKYLGMALGFPEKSADVRKSKDAAQLYEMLCSWQQAAAMLEAGEISKEDYDKWRYHYPEFDATQKWAKVMSQRLSDTLLTQMEGEE